MRDGIRRSKDLRARFRKFLILTNERKQMSKTTLRKRIALTAVTAIGAGLLSVVPVSTANAADNVAPSATATNPTQGEGRGEILNIASATSLTGDYSVTADSETSVGLVSVSDIAGGLSAGTTQTAVLLSTGTIVVYTSSTGVTKAAFITVTGGTIAKSAGADGINSTSTVIANTNDNAKLVAGIRPSSGSTSMVIRMYQATSTTYGADEATALATGLVAPTLGTLSGQITVTISPTTTAGVMSPANSALYTVNAATDSSDDGQTADDPTAAIQNNGLIGCVNVQLNDAYGIDISSTAGLLTATATNNAVVAFAAADCAAGLVAGSTFYTASPADVVMSVAQPTAGAALSTTVTILYNNVVVGTKSFVIRGKVAKVTVSSPKTSAADGTAGVDSATVKFEDAAGNTIYPVAGNASYPLSSTVFGITAATAKSGYVTAASISTTVPDATTATTGKISWTCGVLSTKQAISMTYVNVDGSTVVSNTFDASCGGAPYSYSASFDKASYAPGEIATLSVTFKDNGGSLASDESAIATHVSAGVSDASISAPGLTMVGAPTSVDRTTNGVKKYTFTVGSTEGSYNAVVAFPTIDDPATVSYTVKAGTASVSNADVLKSIVALIASINKQIQALQKLILKR